MIQCLFISSGGVLLAGFILSLLSWAVIAYFLNHRD